MELAFSGNNLNSIIVENGNPFYDSRENCNAIIRTSDNTLIIGSKNTQIPNSVTTIGECAFEYCTGLTEVTIPNSVTEIGNYAFFCCTGLAELTIPNSVTTIRNYAFGSCSSVNSVTSLNPTPPTLDSFAFNEVFGATLHVPEGCKSAYQEAIGWKNFFSIVDDAGVPENILIEKRAEALETCETAMTVYDDYMSYYDGEGMEHYIQTAEKQAVNSSDADSVLDAIEQLAKKLSESGMADDDIASYTETLNSIKESVTALKDENDGALADNSFLDKVQDYYENVAAFHDRLARYKEGIESATALKDLDSIISEIEQDAKNAESSYLQPVVSEYQKLADIAARLVQISEELDKCRAQALSCSDEIDSSIESMIADRKANANDRLQHAMTVHEEYMSYYDGDGMEHYNQTAEKKEGNSNDAGSVLDDIEQLAKKLSESGMADDDIASYTETLNSIKESVTALKDENDGALADNSFLDKVQDYYENVAAFHDRLAQYKEGIESATALKDLDSIISEIEQDAENAESSYLQLVVSEYQKLADIAARLVQISEELEKCKSQVLSCSDEIDAIITEIAKVVNTESEYIIVYTLNGLPHSVKKDELMSLPKGIYIVNGKKVLIK